jgi:hypothetical protein
MFWLRRFRIKQGPICKSFLVLFFKKEHAFFALHRIKPKAVCFIVYLSPHETVGVAAISEAVSRIVPPARSDLERTGHDD